MSYYALTDSDWPWDDEHEGRAVVVHADSPEEAVKVATEKHLKEFPGAGGITWKVARLNLVGFQDASWEDDNQPTFEALTYYSDGINGLPDRAPLPESDRPPQPVPDIDPVGYVTTNELTKLRLGVSCVDLFGKVVPKGFDMVPLYASPQPVTKPAMGGGDNQPRYTTKRLHDEIAKAKAYGIEKAAALVDEMIDDDCFPLPNRHRISSAIRALDTAGKKP